MHRARRRVLALWRRGVTGCARLALGIRHVHGSRPRCRPDEFGRLRGLCLHLLALVACPRSRRWPVLGLPRHAEGRHGAEGRQGLALGEGRRLPEVRRNRHERERRELEKLYRHVGRVRAPHGEQGREAADPRVPRAQARGVVVLHRGRLGTDPHRSVRSPDCAGYWWRRALRHRARGGAARPVDRVVNVRADDRRCDGRGDRARGLLGALVAVVACCHRRVRERARGAARLRVVLTRGVARAT